MKCEKCKSEWNSSKPIQVCPFCGESLVQSEIKKPEEILSYIMKEYGIDVFRKKKLLLSYFSDFAPHLNKEYKLLKNCCSTDFISVLLSSDSSSNESKEIAIKKALRLLMDECFMSEEYASNVVNWITIALKWELSSTKAQSLTKQRKIEKAEISELEHIENDFQSTTVNNTERKNKFTRLKFGFCKEKYEYESENIEYQLGMRSCVQEDFKDALERFEKAYNNGNTLAGTKLAQMYYFGKGCDVNYDKARSIFKYNADAENCPLAKAWIADMYRMGKGCEKNEIKAKEIYVANKKNLVLMCEYGDSDAQYFLGFDLMYGTLGEKNPNEGLKWLEKSSVQGHVAAKVEVAKCYLYGNPVEKQERIGFEMLSSISHTSNKRCHYELGKIFYYGMGIDKDYSLAYKHFLFAAERGHFLSQNFVGDMLYFGRGIKRDYVKAREWYEKAAEHDNINALMRLGYIYYLGEGIEPDKSKAFQYIKRAADLGNERAQYMISFWYFNNNFELYDTDIGFYYLTKAANNGFAAAQYVLAQRYFEDEFYDEDKCFYWYQKAADNGYDEAERVMGTAYETGFHFKKDEHEAFKWYFSSANHDNILSTIKVSEMFFTGIGVGKDRNKATQYLSKASHLISSSDSEDVKWTMIKMADLVYQYGDDNMIEYAITLYDKASVLGINEGLYLLTRIYFVDLTHPDYFIHNEDNTVIRKFSDELRDSVKKMILEKFDNEPSFLVWALSDFADKLDDGKVYSLLGTIMENGWEVNTDVQKAIDYYIKAARKDSIYALCRLGLINAFVLNKPDEAFKCIKESYESGCFEAARALAILYKNGIGVKKDKNKAKDLLRKAVAKGDDSAAEELKKFWF
ncbi:tetratricopeptide repeat protein [Ruminococcus sp. zg-924]|uniref:tetratricopeptide repeat protein n=1 Tax=Ruminococcus sp. zg-924 TaxID=2678505 RepID=UPI00210A1F0E|nr:hypothetical protein [Ruminococcus sp. zg-924]MCQ4022824.1 hypothetical protein [Ruminococcus sp. zg-924]